MRKARGTNRRHRDTEWDGEGGCSKPAQTYSSAIRSRTDSQLPNISRFTPILAPNLPTTGNMAAFFGHRSSLMVQTRVPNDYTTILPGANNGQVMVVTNPDTGISVLLVQYVNHAGGYASWRIAAMWGSAVGNEKGGQIVKSA